MLTCQGKQGEAGKRGQAKFQAILEDFTEQSHRKYGRSESHVGHDIHLLVSTSSLLCYLAVVDLLLPRS